MNRLIWNGQELDLSDNTKIGITFQVNNISDLQSRQGNFSNIFKVPKTSKNRLILGFADNVNTQSEVMYKKALVDYFENDIEIVKNGIGIIDSVDKNFNLRILSGTSNIFTSIENITVGKLYQDIPRGDFVWLIQDEIVSSRDGNKPYVFPLVNHKENTDLIDENNIIDVSNMLPHLFVKNIFERIANVNNYNFSGTFIESDIFQKLILSPDKISYSQDIIRGNVSPNPEEPPFPFYDGISGGFDRFTDPIISGSIPEADINEATFTYYFNTTSEPQFIARFNSGYYPSEPEGEFNNTIGFYGEVFFNYALSFKLSKTSGSFTPRTNYGIELQVLDNDTNEILWRKILLDNDDDDYFFPFNFEGSSSIVNLWKPYQKIKFRIRIKLQENKLSGFDYRVSFSESGTGFNQSPLFQSDGARTLFNSSQVYGGIFYFNQFFNMKVVDLIKDVMNLYAVTLDVNDINKTAKFNFNSDISKNKINYIDWTKKNIDVKTIDIRIAIGNYAQNNLFLYAKDDTVLSGFGDSSVIIENETLTNTKTALQLKVSATQSDDLLTNFGSYVIPRIKLRSGVISENKINPRILIFDKKAVSDEFTFKDNTIEVLDFQTNEDIPFAYFNKSGEDNSLHFDFLIPNYYQTFLSLIRINKKIIIYVFLNAMDIINLDFNRPIYINVQSGEVYAEGYFYLNQIYQYIGGLTKVELIKI